MIFSQAVLEHVDDLPMTYEMMRRWSSSEGYVSHEIDFRSHQFARHWNGHWTYSDRAWSLIRGRLPFTINRAPLSTHLRLLDETGFEVVNSWVDRLPSRLKTDNLAPRFRSLAEDDLTAAMVLIQARKRVALRSFEAQA
jgi:hypothetical protein